MPAHLREAYALKRWNGYQPYVDPVFDLAEHVTTLAVALGDQQLRTLADELRGLASKGSEDCFDQAVQDEIGGTLERLREAVRDRKAARMSATVRESRPRVRAA